MSSSDDEVMEDDDRFQLFLDDSASEDSDEERRFEEEDDDDDEDDEDVTSSENDGDDDGRFKFRRNVDFDENDFIEEDDDDLLDDGDYETEFRHSAASFPAPMPWPPAIVSQQNQIQNEQNSSGKKKKPGIIYLSSIPPDFNVARTITFFSQFGKIGRVFLQPDMKEKAKRRDKMARNFTEGWVEFLSKRVAKEVAANLNNTQVGGSKRSKSHDVLWNIKYLPRFKWTHLSERLAYERASHTQKMRAEVSQAKREADFYRSNVEKSRKMLKRSKAGEESGRLYEFRQKETDDVMRSKRSKDDDESQQSKKKKNKKAKNKNRQSNEMSQKVGKKDKRSSVEGSDAQPPSKRARTRSSDRKEFLQSVFGAKT